jgi:hypothetical protein
VTGTSASSSEPAAPFGADELARHRRELDEFLARRRPPVRVRAWLDIAGRLEGDRVEIVELRPDRHRPPARLVTPVALVRHRQPTGTWLLSWRGPEGEWLPYEPAPEHPSLADALAVVYADDFGCFFG